MVLDSKKKLNIYYFYSVDKFFCGCDQSENKIKPNLVKRNKIFAKKYKIFYSMGKPLQRNICLSNCKQKKAHLNVISEQNPTKPKYRISKNNVRGH